MIVAFMVLLVLVGTVAFHFYSPWWFTEIASNWAYIDDTIILTFWVTGIVFIIVVGFTAYCIFKFSNRPGLKADYEPESGKLETWLTVGTALGVAIMLAPGLFVWNEYVTVPDDAVEFEVMGQQWAWSYRLPGVDGKLGTTDATNVNDDNPFGINLDDADGRDDVLVQFDDLHIAIDQPVKVLLRSLDVLHDFYVPEFRAKMDIVPGSVTYYWFRPIRTGRFDVMCFELCGTEHYQMRSAVVVDEPADYQLWLQDQLTFADYLANAAPAPDEALTPVLAEAKADNAPVLLAP
jgi:cytochrome c oxidase subunit 2